MILFFLSHVHLRHDASYIPLSPAWHESMDNQQLPKGSAQLSGAQLLLGDTWKQLHPNRYTQLFRLRLFYQGFQPHHRENIRRQMEQKHTWTHAENHSVHLHTQRDTSTAEAVFTKQQTECSMFLAMLEKSNSAPNHEDFHLCNNYHSSLAQTTCLGWEKHSENGSQAISAC